MDFTNYIDKAFITLLIFGGICVSTVLFGAYKYTHPQNRPQFTKYQAFYDGEHINCNMMTMTKNCANLSDCDDKNSYFCVSNVKMFVDKK